MRRIIVLKKERESNICSLADMLRIRFPEKWFFNAFGERFEKIQDRFSEKTDKYFGLKNENPEYNSEQK